MPRHPHRPIDPTHAASMLDGPRLAIVGASPSSGNFGATVLQELHQRGRDVVAVHPRATEVAGVACHPSLAEVPGTVDVAIVMVGADAAVEVVRQCAELGIHKVWLFKGAGRGAASDEAIELAEQLGLDVVAGACPLMFLEPVGWIHRIHRGVRRATGAVAAA